jgi:anti-anti-sigma factor
MLRLVARLVQTRGETAGEQMSPYPDERSAMLLYRRPAPSFGRSALSALGRGLQEPSWRSVCFKERLSHMANTPSVGDLTIEEDEIGGIPVVYVRGELDTAACRSLEERLLAFAIATHPRVILDFIDVSYAEAAPLGVIVKVHADLAARGGAMAVVCCQPNVGRLLHAVGLHSTLNLFDTVESAVEHLRALG